MMMAAAKNMDWLTSAARDRNGAHLAAETAVGARMRCKVLGPEPRCAAASARCRKMFSTMMTVASTTRPKSMAPTDSRLADSPRSTMRPIANDSANGIVSGDDHGAAQIAEEHPLQEKDEHDARDHVVQHGAGRDVDQVAAVVDALNADARRQNAAVIDLVHFGLDPLDRRHAFGAAAHQHDALDDVVRRRRSPRCRAAADCRW